MPVAIWWGLSAALTGLGIKLTGDGLHDASSGLRDLGLAIGAVLIILYMVKKS